MHLRDEAGPRVRALRPTALTTLARGARHRRALVAGCASPAGVRRSHALIAPRGRRRRAPATDWPRHAAGGRAAAIRSSTALVEQRARRRSRACRPCRRACAQAQAAVDAAGAARAAAGQRLGRPHRPALHARTAWCRRRWPARRAGTTALQISASWELDLFGRQRAALDVGDRPAARRRRPTRRPRACCSPATSPPAYVNLGAPGRGARRRAAGAGPARADASSLVRQRIDAGLDTNVELRQAEGFIAQTRVEIEALDEAIARSAPRAGRAERARARRRSTR